jgi:hypothetical protein
MYEVMKSVSCNTACFYTTFMLNTSPTGCVNISSEKEIDPILVLFSNEAWFHLSADT